MLILLAVALVVNSFYSVSPVIALACGFVAAALGISRQPKLLTKISRVLMGVAIVSLGFTVNLIYIATLTQKYLFVTLSGIFFTIIFGWYLGRRLKLERSIAVLIACGTAICGASAIAAVSVAIGAKPNQVSTALAVVLIFNAIALISFPLLGGFLHLSPEAFGAWAGLAIHDTSSVVGAAVQFSAESVTTATTTKLSRAIWISPLVIIFSYLLNESPEKKLSLKIPWFIWGYLLAAASASLYSLPQELVSTISLASRRAFSLAIFLIGAAVDYQNFKKITLKPFILGLALWAFAAFWSLLFV